MLQTHSCKWQEMSKGKEIKLGSQCNTEVQKKSLTAPKSTALGWTLNSRQPSVLWTLQAESLAKSPITTRQCAYRNIYTAVFFNRSPCLPSGAHTRFILSRGQMQMLIILCPFPYTLTIELPNLSLSSWEVTVSHEDGTISSAFQVWKYRKWGMRPA